MAIPRWLHLEFVVDVGRLPSGGDETTPAEGSGPTPVTTNSGCTHPRAIPFCAVAFTGGFGIISSMLSRLRIVFLGLVLTCVVTARGWAQIPLQPDDTVVFYGNSMVERLLEQGELQAWIHLSDPAKKLHFRSFAWTGDEVGHRLRAEGYADHMKSLLALWPARCVVVGYGMNEAFAGPAGLAEFRSQLGVLLDQLARLHPGARFVLLSPTAVEAGGQGRDAAERNRDVALYSAAIAEAASARGGLFLDLFAATQRAYAGGAGRLTGNGLHLNEAGNRAMARVIASAFVGEAALARVEPARLREVASAAGQLAHDVAEVVRPKNGILYYGQRKRAEEREAEIPLYLQRIEKDDALVHQIAASPTARFADAPFIALLEARLAELAAAGSP